MNEEAEMGSVTLHWEGCEQCKHGIKSGGCDQIGDAPLAPDKKFGRYFVTCDNFAEGENHDGST